MFPQTGTTIPLPLVGLLLSMKQEDGDWVLGEGVRQRAEEQALPGEEQALPGEEHQTQDAAHRYNPDDVHLCCLGVVPAIRHLVGVHPLEDVVLRHPLPHLGAGRLRGSQTRVAAGLHRLLAVVLPQLHWRAAAPHRGGEQR